MGHIEVTRTLSATPEALFAQVSNLNSWDQWFSVHEKWMADVPAQLTEGTQLVAKIVMLGMANKIDWTVKEVSAPSKLVLAGVGMAGVKTEFTFTIEAADGGSQITVAGDFRSKNYSPVRGRGKTPANLTGGSNFLCLRGVVIG